MKGYIKLRRWIIGELQYKLSADLTYHNLEHTMSVLNACNLAIRREKLFGEQAKLLRLAALAHDIGFTISMDDHEQAGVNLMLPKMEEFGFSKAHQQIIRGLILATKVPQNPKTKLEQILCDADLDYLGGPYYYQISERLYHELLNRRLIQSHQEWIDIQIRFLKAHRYQTDFALKYRKPGKRKRLFELQST